MDIEMAGERKEQADATAQQPEEKSFFKIIIHSFFIIPFLIAVFCVLLFAGIHLLTREQRSAFDYLEDVKIGGLSKRWQGAFELSKILANPQLYPQDERFTSELITAFKQAEHDDPRVRQYLALAMGRTGKAEFVTPLLEGLSEEKEANLPAIIYSLGMLQQKSAIPILHEFADHPNARIRSITIAALGTIGEPASKETIRRHLNDPEPNVQWVAAVSLAHMSDNAGKPVLMKMLQRTYWSQFPEVDREETVDLIRSAISAAAYLNDAEINEQISQLARHDPNVRIRSAAMDVIDPIR